MYFICSKYFHPIFEYLRQINLLFSNFSNFYYFFNDGRKMSVRICCKSCSFYHLSRLIMKKTFHFLHFQEHMWKIKKKGKIRICVARSGFEPEKICVLAIYTKYLCHKALTRWKPWFCPLKSTIRSCSFQNVCLLSYNSSIDNRLQTNS